MYKLKFLVKGSGMAASDFSQNSKQEELINVKQISSLSDIKAFHLPLSGTYVNDYAVVNMQNGDRFFIDKLEHVELRKVVTESGVANTVRQNSNNILTKEQIKEFEEAAKPLVKYLAENHHPHMTVIVDCSSAEIMEGKASVKIDEFILD